VGCENNSLLITRIQDWNKSNFSVQVFLVLLYFLLINNNNNIGKHQICDSIKTVGNKLISGARHVI